MLETAAVLVLVTRDNLVLLAIDRWAAGKC